MTKEYVEERYNLLFELYGVQSRGWSMLHEQFNRYVFCPDNRKSLIAEIFSLGRLCRRRKEIQCSLLYGN